MIKVSVTQEGPVVKLQFETNDIESDRDKLDLIGQAIVGKYEKRGGYLPTSDKVIRISVLMPEQKGV